MTEVHNHSSPETICLATLDVQCAAVYNLVSAKVRVGTEGESESEHRTLETSPKALL